MVALGAQQPAHSSSTTSQLTGEKPRMPCDVEQTELGVPYLVRGGLAPSADARIRAAARDPSARKKPAPRRWP